MSQKYKRVFLIVLDSVGMGNAADAAHCRKDRQKEDGCGDGVEDTDKSILERHKDCGGDQDQDKLLSQKRPFVHPNLSNKKGEKR